MAIAERLSRYGEFARFLAKYGRTDFADPATDAVPPPTEKQSADAETFARDLEALGPTFIKLGQLLSTRADILSPAYVTALERLQDDIAPFDSAEAIAIVESELGVRLSKAFSEFDPTPVAAASLGQVHRAVLRSGREVAVKVQRPEVRERVMQDLDVLDDVAKLLERFSTVTRTLDVAHVLEEFRQTMMRELDYRQEARSMVAIAHHLRDFDRIVIPLPVDDYTTARVLTMDYIKGTKITRVGPLEWTDIQGDALADELFRAYLHQILVDGLFHADPHPGNVFLTPDGRLALIDLGMVGRLSHTIQERLFRLLLAIADARGDEAANVVIAMGDKLEGFEDAQMRRMVVELIGRYQHTPAGELNVGRVMLDIAHSGGQFGLRLPSELPLLGKTLLNLHEVGRVLDTDFDVQSSMRTHASNLMRRRMLKSLTPTHLLSTAVEVRDLAERLPERFNRILDALAANDLRLKVELIDHGSIIDGLQKVANRIALGVVLAALILGAATMMRVPTPFTIFGYPGIAMLLFVAAAAGGIWMAWTIVAGDVRRIRHR